MSQIKALLNQAKNIPSNLGNKGQIAVEYILLLSVAVVIAVVIVTTMVSREEGEEGFVIQAWKMILDTLGSDYADDIIIPEE